MSKCNKVKNPCKICLGPVSQKNGLQCQGACENWVHYTCLNYTPGKIKDIKDGIIKVTCPCPDCKTTMPKEYRTDLSFSCNNSKCPANRPPKCENSNCPTNDMGKGHPPPRQGPACPLGKCGTECKQYSDPKAQSTGTAAPCTPPQPQSGYPEMSPMSSSDACLSGDRCASGCSSKNNVSGDNGKYQNSGESGSSPSLQVVEQLCNTVGQLTNQINDLMSKMKQAVREKNGSGGGACGPKPQTPKNNCPQQGPKSMCPKPCYCPGNPSKRQ